MPSGPELRTEAVDGSKAEYSYYESIAQRYPVDMNSVDTFLQLIAHTSDGGQLVGKLGGLKDDAVSQVCAHPSDDSSNGESSEGQAPQVEKKVRFEDGDEDDEPRVCGGEAVAGRCPMSIRTVSHATYGIEYN